MDKINILDQYLPSGVAPAIARWIDLYQCQFKISRSRTTKLGDYRPPYGGLGHRISVNYNLNSYAFLVTTVHEFAHLITWNEYKRKAKPHGKEWKSNFKRMMVPFLESAVFPEDIRKAIAIHLENPSASSCADLSLFRAMQRYDDKPAGFVRVEELTANSLFTLKNGRAFRKQGLVRKRYRCVELKTGMIYLFNPLTEVEAVV